MNIGIVVGAGIVLVGIIGMLCLVMWESLKALGSAINPVTICFALCMLALVLKWMDHPTASSRCALAALASAVLFALWEVGAMAFKRKERQRD